MELSPRTVTGDQIQGFSTLDFNVDLIDSANVRHQGDAGQIPHSPTFFFLSSF